MKVKSYNANQSFLDLLFQTLMGFVILFIIAFSSIVVDANKNKNNVEMKAEFVITILWDKDLKDDVDLYVQDPQGKIVYFQNREVGLLHLDRDDMGLINDTIILPDGSKMHYKENREMVVIRGIEPGEYIVNVHMYRKSEYEQPEPVAVNIKLEKMNPYSVVVAKDIVLENNGDEKTAFRFTMDSSGNIKDINYLEKSMVKIQSTDPLAPHAPEEGEEP